MEVYRLCPFGSPSRDPLRLLVSDAELKRVDVSLPRIKRSCEQQRGQHLAADLVVPKEELGGGNMAGCLSAMQLLQEGSATAAQRHSDAGKLTDL